MFWLQQTHITISQLWEHVDFQVLSAYDVVAAPGWRIELEEQPWAELWLIREGRCEINQDKQRVVATSGDAVLLQTGRSRVTVNLDDKPLSIIGFSCNARLAGGIDFLALLDLSLLLKPDPAKLESLLNNIVEESQSHRFGYSFALHGLAQLALVEVLRAGINLDSERTAVRAGEKLQSKISPEIIHVLHYIEMHFAESFEVCALADIAHLSPKHFSRRFKQAMGLSPMEYVRGYRLQQARQRLAARDEPIALTASKCGFVDAAHFSRAFKSHFNMSPLAYKQHYRAMKITPQPTKS